MFGLGMWEIAMIAIVALLVVGPDKLPDAAKKLSRGIRDFRQQTRDLSRDLEDDTELGSAVRDLKSALRGDEIRSALYEPPHLTKASPPGDGDKADEDDEGDEGDEGGEKNESGDSDDSSAEAPAALPEASADDAIGSLAPDPDLPVLKTPKDVVAKSDALDHDEDQDSEHDKTDKAHG